MNFTISAAQNPVYDANNDLIILEVQFYETGDEWHPYTAYKHDTSDQCTDYWYRAANGEFGTIQAYVPPPEPEANSAPQANT
jgi:hypothetical protein